MSLEEIAVCPGCTQGVQWGSSVVESRIKRRGNRQGDACRQAQCTARISADACRGGVMVRNYGVQEDSSDLGRRDDAIVKSKKLALAIKFGFTAPKSIRPVTFEEILYGKPKATLIFFLPPNTPRHSHVP